MFVFVVPLKGRTCCSDWLLTSELCIGAINSMLANGPRVKVVLVCNDQPEGVPHDPRLIIRSIASPAPTTRHEMMVDKYWKIKIGLTLAREFAPTWLMRADADDLISRRLVSFIEQQPINTAWYCESGWVHRPGSRWAMKLHDFHLVCGTSCVTYVSREELPDSVERPNDDYYLLTHGHNVIVDFLRKSGVRVNPIPFSSTIYVTDYGDNWSGPWLTNRRSTRWQIRKILNTRPIARLCDEFGMTRPIFSPSLRIFGSGPHLRSPRERVPRGLR